MKHKTELRKGLARVRVTGKAEVGTEILNGAGKLAGAIENAEPEKKGFWRRLFGG